MAAGNFVANIDDTLGCSIDSLIIVAQPDKISLSSLEIFPVYCRGYSDGKVQAQATGGNGGYTYYLRPGLNVNNFGFFENLHEGSYTLTVKDALGCTFDTVIAVTPPMDPLRIQITKKDLGCYGTGTEGYTLANVLGENAPYTYLWSEHSFHVQRILRLGCCQVCKAYSQYEFMSGFSLYVLFQRINTIPIIVLQIFMDA